MAGRVFHSSVRDGMESIKKDSIYAHYLLRIVQYCVYDIALISKNLRDLNLCNLVNI